MRHYFDGVAGFLFAVREARLRYEQGVAVLEIYHSHGSQSGKKVRHIAPLLGVRADLQWEGELLKKALMVCETANCEEIIDFHHEDERLEASVQAMTAALKARQPLTLTIDDPDPHTSSWRGAKMFILMALTAAIVGFFYGHYVFYIAIALSGIFMIAMMSSWTCLRVSRKGGRVKALEVRFYGLIVPLWQRRIEDVVRVRAHLVYDATGEASTEITTLYLYTADGRRVAVGRCGMDADNARKEADLIDYFLRHEVRKPLVIRHNLGRAIAYGVVSSVIIIPLLLSMLLF